MRATGWAAIGNIGTVAAQAAALVLLAKLGGPDNVGRYSLALALTAPVILFSNLQLRAVQATDQSGVFGLSTYTVVRILALVCALPVIAIVAVAQRIGGETLAVVALVAAAKAIESLSDLFLGVMLRYEQMGLFARSQLLRSATLLVGLATGMSMSNNLSLGLAVVSLAWGLVLWSDVIVATRLDRRLSTNKERATKAEIGRLIRSTAPLGVISALISLRSALPMYFLQAQSGLTAVGIFGAIAYLPSAGTTIVGATGQASLPRLSLSYVRRPTSYVRLLAFMCWAAGLAGVGGVVLSLVAGREILTFLYSLEYAGPRQVWVLTLLSAAAAITNVNGMLGIGLVATRRFLIQIPIHALAVLTCAGLAAVLVPRLDLPGAALSLVGSALIWLLASTLVLGLILRTRSASSADRSGTSRAGPADSDRE